MTEYERLKKIHLAVHRLCGLIKAGKNPVELARRYEEWLDGVGPYPSSGGRETPTTPTKGST